MFAKRFPRIAAALLALALVAAACGSDDESEESDPDDVTSSVTTPTTSSAPSSDDSPNAPTSEPDDETVATSQPPAGDPSGAFASGTVTTADGFQSAWTLSGDGNELCFRADITHPDAQTAAEAGTGIDDCLAPASEVGSLDDALSVDVGTVDGEKTIGFLWGRAAAEVLSLWIEHSDGTQTEVPLVPGPGGIKVFGYAVEIASLPPVVTLDALSGTKLEDSEPIRDFLRVGPTYPVAGPVTVPVPPDYPTN
ncbi:MAG: hypothetical protein ACI9C1_001096 [Candidatus Aldehydirespiratoraceae bacterium]